MSGKSGETLWLEMSFENPECPFITTTASYPGLNVQYIKGYEKDGDHTYRVKVHGDNEVLDNFVREVGEKQGCVSLDVIGGADRQSLIQGVFTGATCIREALNEVGATPEQIEIKEGRGFAGMHVQNRATLQNILRNLNTLPNIKLENVARQGSEMPWPKSAFIERFGLTEKQYNVLERAYEMGYFDAPRRVNATAVAEDLDLTISTVMDHLQKGLSKVLNNYFDTMPEEA